MSAEDEITLPAVRRIAATFDLDSEAFSHGSALPAHWYSMFFTANARQSRLGHDGHPRKGDFLPPVPLPRRMFVGRTVEFPGVLRVGDRATKRSEIAALVPKSGRSGRLVFVTVRHVIQAGAMPAVIENQEIVYREAVSAAKSPDGPATATTGPSAEWSVDAAVDPVLSFRYSAITWNGHRIHYDADYARREEGYPGCVVNGALTLHLVVDAALSRYPGRLETLRARLMKPLFVGTAFRLSGARDGAGVIRAWALDSGGALAASAEIGLGA